MASSSSANSMMESDLSSTPVAQEPLKEEDPES